MSGTGDEAGQEPADDRAAQGQAADRPTQGQVADQVAEELKETAAQLMNEARDALRGAADAVGDATDTVRATAQGLVDDHGPAVTDAVRSAGAFLDGQTGGRTAEATDRLDELARRAVSELGTGAGPQEADEAT